MLMNSILTFFLLLVSVYQYSARIPEPISRIKCREYGQIFNSCNFSNDEIVQQGQFPHIVSIGYGVPNDTGYECSGVLISDQYILTTSFCRYSKDYGRAIKVRLGVLNLKDSQNETHIQEINIRKVYNHPLNKPPIRYYDISLMELEHPVEINEYVRPACLPNLNEEHDKYILTGWEVFGVGDIQKKDFLTAHYNVYEVLRQVCNKFYIDSGGRKLKHGLDETHICAGPSNSVCKMLGGSPLQSKDKSVNCMYDIHGIASFGISSCNSTTPTVFTKIAPYIDWIEETVWPLNYFTNFGDLVLIGH